MWQGVSSTGTAQERRSEERRKSRVNKLVHALVKAGEEFQTFLYLVDISTGGLRVNLDRRLTPESIIELDFPVGPYVRDKEARLQATCRVVWNRPLLGGTFVHGLQFIDLSPASEEIISKLFIAFTPEGRRERFRLNQVLNVAYKSDDSWIPRNACDISPEGLGLQLSSPLPEDTVIPFRIYLDEKRGSEPVEIDGKVSFTAEFDEGDYRIGIKFVNVNDVAASRIQAYIDRHV